MLNRERMAKKFMAAVGRKPPRKLTAQRFINLFKTWRPYAFLGPYCIGSFGGSTGYFNLWLKSTGKYSVQQLNIIPTAGNAIGVIGGYIWPTFADIMGVRWSWFLVSNFWYVLGNLILAIWNESDELKLFANLIQFLGDSTQNIFNAIGQEAFQDDAEARSICIALGNTICYTFSAWLPLLLFPTPEAPHYKYGYKFSVTFYLLQDCSLFLFIYLSRRESAKKKKVLNDFVLYVHAEDVVVRDNTSLESAYEDSSTEKNIAGSNCYSGLDASD
ncbi:hypothetical protein V1527DRAFT_477985 [Lipomyces starkeyi]